MKKREVKIVLATREEPANDIIKRARVKTIKDITYNQLCGDHRVWWSYKGKKIPRPSINKWEEIMFKEFNIKIKYTNGKETHKANTCSNEGVGKASSGRNHRSQRSLSRD